MSDGPPSRQLEVLQAICNLPTAPFCEEHVAAWLEDWARERRFKQWRDPAGNLYVEYRRGRRGHQKTPLVIEAHMDHPGFFATGNARGGIVRAEFRGGVKPSFFDGAGVRFWREGDGGRWIKGRVIDVKTPKSGRVMQVRIAAKEKIPVGSLGMWDLPDASVNGDLFAARVCDDLAGVAAMVCLLEHLQEHAIDGHVLCLFDRGEEVGFAGVLAVCENGWIPRGSRVIGLETSKASSIARQGEGVVVRVGDRTGIFSAGLTHFLTQAAGFVSDDHPAFKFQRRLMDGGMCNSTAFAAWGFDSAALCLALGNYHNMTLKGEAGWKSGARTGKAIASETIHLADFTAMVQLLVQVVQRYDKYVPGFGEVRDRLARMHRDEHLPKLYDTVVRHTPAARLPKKR